MRGRPKKFDEKEVMEQATEVFWSQGYGASSADELLKAMNIGKGSFYLSFKGGKRELFEKSLDQFMEQSMQQFHKDLSEAENPVEFIRHFFLKLVDMPLEKKLKGCYLGNALVEMSSTDHELKEKASRLLSRLESSFEAIIEKARHDGLVTSPVSSGILARHLINLWNGINLTRRMYPSDENLKEVIELNLRILTS